MGPATSQPTCVCPENQSRIWRVEDRYVKKAGRRFGGFRELVVKLLQIKIAPGYYEVMLKVCSYNHIPAFPRIRLKAKPGMTYLFASSVVMNGKAVSAEYKEIPTAADTTPDK